MFHAGNLRIDVPTTTSDLFTLKRDRYDGATGRTSHDVLIATESVGELVDWIEGALHDARTAQQDALRDQRDEALEKVAALQVRLKS